jgi:hypothetical protein
MSLQLLRLTTLWYVWIQGALTTCLRHCDMFGLKKHWQPVYDIVICLDSRSIDNLFTTLWYVWIQGALTACLRHCDMFGFKEHWQPVNDIVICLDSRSIDNLFTTLYVWIQGALETCWQHCDFSLPLFASFLGKSEH